MPDIPSKTDYQGNSNKDKEKAKAAKPEKIVEKVVVGTVIVEKKTLGKKFKDTFLDKEFFLNMARGVYRNRIVPNAKNMLFDTGMEMLKQSVYRSGDPRAIFDPAKSVISKFTYNAPVQHNMPYPNSIPVQSMLAGSPGVMQQPQAIGPRRYGRPDGENFILSTREEADLVLETLVDYIETYDVATLQDLHEMLGVKTDQLANMWGWTNLKGATITQRREGWVVNLPQAEPINVR